MTEREKKNPDKHRRSLGKKNLPDNKNEDLADNKHSENKISDNLRQRDFPIVGIGASAGGLEAFESFFSGMPTDMEPGMAFILVQHLAPDHKSMLTDLIKRYTRMPVFEVEDGMSVRPNCVYIIPPNNDMAFINGSLQLFKPEEPRGLRLPIDFLFRSLAQDQHERSIGIVLSGTGSDGTLGIRAIKKEGGMVMAQTPSSTSYNGMPNSAIETGLVDHELLPSEMPATLISYAAQIFGEPSLRPEAAQRVKKNESAVNKIFIILRSHTGQDFSLYKPTTIHRRIERRMAILRIERIDSYVKYLEKNPNEVEALFKDLLIGVTSFFRDPEAFKVLEGQIIPNLITKKQNGGDIRIWSAGCSTGEEAYSLAILLMEHLEKIKQNRKIQIFATDIDSQAIVTARAGVYPSTIASDVSPERLDRFFTAEANGSSYRINKSVRDMLVFSEQNAIKDPPFSRLDLISCRNLMIYMGVDLQKRLISIFHYALNPGGSLFLGTSETVGEFNNLFEPIDRKMKIYRRKEGFHLSQRAMFGHFVPSMTQNETAPQRIASKTIFQNKLPLREITEKTLLEHASLIGVLVNGHGDILYLHGRTGLYLELPPGEPGINNILKMAKTGLRSELGIAINKAEKTKEVVRHPGIRIKTNGDNTTVNLTVRPILTDTDKALDAPLFLVILEEIRSDIADQTQKALTQNSSEANYQTPDIDMRIAALKQELRTKEEYLQAANEELETSNEELKSFSEEMQSVNEELQSTNEELETSREELQSVNEEMSTINAELQAKVAALSQTNNDMNNLLAGTGIATIFVDTKLKILRFTPTATRIINLITSDMGRPVAHIASNLIGYGAMVEDAKSVLDNLIPKEKEVQSTEGSWFTMRIQPYRTIENVIEGVVLTFVDITEKKKVQETLKESEFRFRQLVESIPQLVWTCTPDGSCDYLSPQWIKFTGVPESKQLGLGWLDQVHPDDRESVIIGWDKALKEGSNYETVFRIRHHSGEYQWFDTRASALLNDKGIILKWFGINMKKALQ